MKTSIILKGPIFILLSLAFIETTCRRFYVLFFKTKKNGLRKQWKKGAGCWIFMKKQVVGMQDQKHLPAFLPDPISKH